MNKIYLHTVVLLFSAAISRADIDRSFHRSDEEIDASLGASAQERGVVSQRTSLLNWQKKIEDCRTLPASEAIPLLGSAVLKLQNKRVFQVAERIPVFDQARNELLAIRGHAEYYQKKIESLRAEVLANAKKSDDEITKMQDNGENVTHESEFEKFSSMVAFPTLASLPSAETVSVLGSYLNDTVGRDGKTLLGGLRHSPGDDFPPRVCNAELATVAVRNLGIEYPPFASQRDKSRKHISDDEIDAWKEWWNEVKEGKRTYRFTGSNIEYGPDGPASPEVVQRIERDRKRDAERGAGERRGGAEAVVIADDPDASRLTTVWGIVAALVLLLGAGFYGWRRSRAA